MISTAVTPPLILFCRQGFKEIARQPWPGSLYISSPIHRAHARQATLHTALRQQSRVAPQCRFLAIGVDDINCLVHSSLYHMGVRLCTTAGLHGSRVGSLMPLRGALHPQARISRTSLQHPPQTGRKKQAPEVSQLCPLKDF